MLNMLQLWNVVKFLFCISVTIPIKNSSWSCLEIINIVKMF